MSVGIRLSTAAIASLGSRLRDDGTIVENRQVGLFENGKYIEMTILVWEFVINQQFQTIHMLCIMWFIVTDMDTWWYVMLISLDGTVNTILSGYLT